MANTNVPAPVDETALYEMWAACPTAIDSTGDTVYLLPSPPATAATPLPPALTRLVGGRTLVTLTAANPGGRELDDVENQVRNARLAAQLAEWRQRHGGPHAPDVHRSYSWEASTGRWFEPGFAAEAVDAAGRAALLQLGAEHGQLAVYEYVYDAATGRCLRSVVSCDATKTTAAETNGENVAVVPVPRPGERHPIYLYPDWLHLYHERAAVLAFFERWARHDAAYAASEAAARLQPFLDRVRGMATAVLPPTVVVEGLDGSGKSTLAKALVEHGQARFGVTPPASMVPLRPAFDALPEAVRRAFYGLSNYVFVDELAAPPSSQLVVVDRFWASTAAYAIARAVEREDDLPPPGDPVYRWPADLPRPRLTIYLDVPIEVRARRIAARGQGFTPEELLLQSFYSARRGGGDGAAAGTGLARRIAVAYERIISELGPDHAVTLDGCLAPDEVLAHAMAAMRERGLLPS